MIAAGVDIGSLVTKALILKDKQILSKALTPTGADPSSAAKETLGEALRKASLSIEEIDGIVSTGYGRRVVEFGGEVLTEISCCAKGAWWIGVPFGRIGTVVDLGGQDTKVISLSQDGEMVDFVMNDKCAAGTGRFLEVMAHALEVRLEDLGELSQRAKAPVVINSTCTVFAESEVISLVAQGKERADIIAGLHNSIAQRIVGMIKEVGERDMIFFAGGGAKNKGIHKALEDKLGKKVYVPDEPQFVVALGAALSALRGQEG
jgi:predicted CoA-substrate-specific enzyme activase